MMRRLDGFAREDPALGLVALRSPADPAPSLRVAGGVVVELDSKRRDDFDTIDRYIAAHGLDLTVAEEAMALDDIAAARLFVDPAVPRAEVVRLVAGMTPAKLSTLTRRPRRPVAQVRRRGLALVRDAVRADPGDPFGLGRGFRGLCEQRRRGRELDKAASLHKV